jgi:AcrR family transcriptional regulator
MSARASLTTAKASPRDVSAKSVAPKGDQTKAAIVDAAMRLFRDLGYEATTMRAIANEAGVSLGNAYYYFASKEHLVQGYYDRIAIDQATKVLPLLANERDLEKRMMIVIDTWIEVVEPYRMFAGKLFKFAAEPDSPLSPFSNESSPTRDAAIALWRYVVEGSDQKIPKELQAELPDVLWLAFLGIVLYWVHDTSLESAKTRLLASRIVPMVVKMIGLARLPMLKSTVNDLVALLGELRGPDAPVAGATS